MKMIRILILGEGSTDYGGPNGVGGWNEGPILELIRKLLQENYEVEFLPILHSAKDKVRGYVNRGLTGHGITINKMILYAKMENIEFDYLVYFADTDKKSSSKTTETQSKRASQEAYGEARQALDLYPEIKGIAMIPLRMNEAWMLADLEALAQVTGGRCELPDSPEMLWGDEGKPTSNHPKRVLARLLSPSGRESNSETYHEIVQHLDIHTLLNNCPVSFGPVIDQLFERGLYVELDWSRIEYAR